MSFVTASGQQFSDTQIRAYFASRPGVDQIARQAAGLGLTADQIAAAMTIGWATPVTADSAKNWVDDHLAGLYGWTSAGALASLLPGGVTIGFDTGFETLNIDSATTSAGPSAVINALALSATAHTTINVTGNAALDLSPGWAVSLLSVKTVDASAFNAGLHVYLYGNTNNLLVKVGGGNDIVVAGFGNDTITAGAGDDVVFDGRGDDTVDAGAGNDWMRGGPGRDVMAGGAGTDTFAYVFVYESQGAVVDAITDFTVGAGGDILDFSGLTHGTAVHTVFDAATSTLHLDIDGNGTMDGVNDMAIQLTGLTGGLTADNFVF
jgi:Ca2+-binding RTX toxin-like protein